MRVLTTHACVELNKKKRRTRMHDSSRSQTRLIGNHGTADAELTPWLE